MPEISRFLGIVVRMYAETDAPHHRPHFHAYYQNHVSVIAIDKIEVIGGSLPRRQLRFIEAWTELHQSELLTNWDRLQKGLFPFKIDPLK